MSVALITFAGSQVNNFRHHIILSLTWYTLL